jgi:hypothetical protein
VSEQINALVAEHEPRVVALDMSRVPDLEYSALRALARARSGSRTAASPCGWWG